jgi:hypothetical protein
MNATMCHVFLKPKKICLSLIELFFSSNDANLEENTHNDDKKHN